MRQPDVRATAPVNAEPRWPAGYIELSALAARPSVSNRQVQQARDSLELYFEQFRGIALAPRDATRPQHEMPRQSPQPASFAAAPPAVKSTSADQVVRPTAPVSARDSQKRFPCVKRIVGNGSGPTPSRAGARATPPRRGSPNRGTSPRQNPLRWRGTSRSAANGTGGGSEKRKVEGGQRPTPSRAGARATPPRRGLPGRGTSPRQNPLLGGVRPGAQRTGRGVGRKRTTTRTRGATEWSSSANILTMRDAHLRSEAPVSAKSPAIPGRTPTTRGRPRRR
jgi:hypothetical protein